MTRTPVALLVVRVQPGAKATKVVGPYGDGIKVQIKSAPEKGQANRELCRFLATQLALTVSEVEVASGTASRSKRLRFHGVDSEGLRRLLTERGWLTA